MYISIIVPCYNEGKVVQNNINKILDYMTNKEIKYEIIGVNDGSTDDTEEQLKEMERLNDKVRCISYSRNCGKGKAVQEGIKATKGDVLLFMDADLSVDLKAIDKVIEEIDKGNDMIIASRRHPNSSTIKSQGLLRKLMGNCCLIITRFMSGLKFKDTQCGFKAFKRELGELFIQKQEIFGWAFDVEYLYIAVKNGYKVVEIPISWKNDEDSKVSPIKSSISFFIELLKIVKNKKKYKA